MVIGNHPYNIGCTSGKWTYVAVDAVGTDVFQHELGHLVGELFDEWAMPSNGSDSLSWPDRDAEFNCAPAPPPPPHWMNKPQSPLARTLTTRPLRQRGGPHPTTSAAWAR